MQVALSFNYSSEQRTAPPRYSGSVRRGTVVDSHAEQSRDWLRSIVERGILENYRLHDVLPIISTRSSPPPPD